MNQPQSHQGSGDSILVRLFDRPSRIKIIEAMLVRYSSALTKEEIAQIAGVDEATFHRNKGLLLELSIIEETPGQNNKTLYRLNQDSSLVQALGDLYSEVTGHAATLTPDDHRREAIDTIHKEANRKTESNSVEYIDTDDFFREANS